MKKLIALLLCLGLVGCATPLHKSIAPNREHLAKVSIGMTKDEVLKVMGTKSFSTYSQGDVFGIPSYLTITNPYRSEILQGKEKTLEVVYYVTDVKKDDNAISDDELTPFVFDNGKLIGWGWSFLNDNTQKYEIRTR